MVIDPRPYAQLCADSYVRTSVEIGPCEFLDGVVAGLPVLAFQGTQDLAQILADLEMLAPSTRSPVGVVGRGALESVCGALGQIEGRAVMAGTRNWVACGHSLGAAEAAIAAGLMTAIGLAPVALLLFGAPRFVYDGALETLLAGAGVNVYSWRHGNDLVTALPPTARALVEPIAFGIPSVAIDNVADHAVHHYLESPSV